MLIILVLRGSKHLRQKDWEFKTSLCYIAKSYNQKFFSWPTQTKREKNLIKYLQHKQPGPCWMQKQPFPDGSKQVLSKQVVALLQHRQAGLLKMPSQHHHKGKTIHKSKPALHFASSWHKAAQARSNWTPNPGWGQYHEKQGSNHTMWPSTLSQTVHLNHCTTAYVQKNPESYLHFPPSNGNKDMFWLGRNHSLGWMNKWASLIQREHIKNPD